MVFIMGEAAPEQFSFMPKLLFVGCCIILCDEAQNRIAVGWHVMPCDDHRPRPNVSHLDNKNTFTITTSILSYTSPSYLQPTYML